MSIIDALARIYVIQAGLKITAPVSLKVKKVWPFFPDASVQVPDFPCFMNEMTALPVDERRMMSQRERLYEVHMQFMAAKATVEDARSAQIALRFWKAAEDAFDADIGLKVGGVNTVTLALLRGGSPTVPVVLQRGGESFIGFDATLAIRIEEEYLWS